MNADESSAHERAAAAHERAEAAEARADKSDVKERTNNLVAVSVAVLAVFMAITKVTDDNVCQAMQRAKVNEVDRWSFFQSKSIKQNLAELGRVELASLAQTTSGEVRTSIDAAVAKYDKEIERYEVEKKGIEEEAKNWGKEYDALNYRDDQFDLSDATLSIALGMLAVTALTGNRWLLKLSWAIGSVGAVMGIAGLTGLKIHSDWLARLLS